MRKQANDMYVLDIYFSLSNAVKLAITLYETEPFFTAHENSTIRAKLWIIVKYKSKGRVSFNLANVQQIDICS